MLCACFTGCDGKGKSAYEIWIENGNTGTEQDFLDSLKGANGQTPTIEINSDGYWVINGVDTGVKARAEIKASQGLRYELQDGSYIVTGMEDCTDTDLVIPSSYNGKPVIGIGEGAFYNSTTITSVTILDGVKTIGGAAFLYCSSIKRVSIPDSVTSIGYMAFFSCESLTDINLPDSLTSIGHQAFSYCSSLTSVTIPENITAIADQTFFNCTSLKNVSIGSKVESIGNMAFQGCQFTDVTIPDSVTVVKYRAFFNCPSLESVVIGSGATVIGNNAFASCNNLTSVEFSIKTGWFVADSESATSGEAVDVSTGEGAAQLLTGTYKDMYFLRSAE